MNRRSFESINYMLRPNKNVERKLIIASLQRLRAEFPISDYRYVGFGSMWFTDFVLMHKILGISDMVTIEREKSRRRRVEFNKPFACISVRMEEAAIALGEVLDDKRSIVWLDYDGALKNAMSGDIETAVGSMSSGSMLLVTVNGLVEQLKGNKRDEVELSPAQYLADICDNPELMREEPRLTRNDFPELIRELLHGRIKAATLAMKPGCEYVPIWSFHYADDADMVTVGGMIANEADQPKLAACGLDGVGYLSANALYEIDLPILTEKEKRALDRLLPCPAALDHKKLEFELRPSEVEAYQQFYLEYPIFNEMAA
ncbi:O-methyltransferase [Mesorhizobium sp.]|uniref:O-methyltransferase n=1 Tax=Mesorhizobium sp. TaxID=1871066 RepID=UPI000FEA9E80|nr:O-methyltransferase [Mesorhizobium sp.]RWQ29892.1 MAG: hypothetical protein EOS19_10145 [Mesorhizobium sp.]